MNIYDDYGNYLGEIEVLLNKLTSQSSPVLYCLSDVINVLDYIYRKYLDKAKIDAELEEIFEIGFGYISNSLNDIKTYYEEYFNKDIVLFNQYANLITYSILIDDLKAYLISEERLTKEKEKALDNALNQIDNVMVNNLAITGDIICDIEEAYEASLPKKNDYKPVYTVFAMIAEELGLY